VRRLVALFAVGVLAAGCGHAKTVTVTTTETVRPTVTTTVAKTPVRVYFLRDGKVAPVAREVVAPPSQARLESLVLSERPTERERAAGFTNDDKQGVTIAQIVYTLTQFDPANAAVLNGKTYTRADFEDRTPTILVESPLPFQAVSSPLRVTGTANTFEATFEYELLDPAGKVLSHNFVTATSGSGTRGTFDFTVPFEARNGLGKLVVYESSAADGSRIHISEIPLSLAR
jgi:germination protein M